jgi:hypothetical protein
MNIFHSLGSALQKVGDSISSDPLVVGKRFEDHVESLFDRKYFTLVEKTHSPATNTKRFVESSLQPDLLWRYEPTKEQFAVECKYRTEKSIDSRDRLVWTYPEQLKRYQEFQKNRNIPVFVVIGLALEDDEEEFGPTYEVMFCIPLSEAKYPALYPSVLDKYARYWYKRFFWKNGVLK